MTDRYTWIQILLPDSKDYIVWLGLEIIILSEVCQIMTNDTTYMWNLKKLIQVNLLTKQTHRHRKQTYGYQRGKRGEGDKLGVWD